MIQTVEVENMAIKYFDTLEYVQRSKEIKEPDALAAYQVKQIELAIETAVSYVKSEVHHNAQNLRDEIDIYKKELATKSELFSVKTELKTDIQTVRAELKAEIQGVRTELKAEIQEVRTELKGDIKDLRYDTLKFVVWTGVGVVITLGGLLGGLIGHGFHWI